MSESYTLRLICILLLCVHCDQCVAHKLALLHIVQSVRPRTTHRNTRRIPDSTEWGLHISDTLRLGPSRCVGARRRAGQLSSGARCAARACPRSVSAGPSSPRLASTQNASPSHDTSVRKPASRLQQELSRDLLHEMQSLLADDQSKPTRLPPTLSILSVCDPVRVTPSIGALSRSAARAAARSRIRPAQTHASPVHRAVCSNRGDRPRHLSFPGWPQLRGGR